MTSGDHAAAAAAGSKAAAVHAPPVRETLAGGVGRALEGVFCTCTCQPERSWERLSPPVRRPPPPCAVLPGPAGRQPGRCPDSETGTDSGSDTNTDTPSHSHNHNDRETDKQTETRTHQLYLIKS
jgi:hypothetical protein